MINRKGPSGRETAIPYDPAVSGTGIRSEVEYDFRPNHVDRLV
jgi:hypothetical protein